jgi:hypothetical protein
MKFYYYYPNRRSQMSLISAKPRRYDYSSLISFGIIALFITIVTATADIVRYQNAARDVN